MKVLLIQSYTKHFRPVFPIGLACIASAIRDAHDVSVFDPNVEPGIRDALVRRLRTFAPDVVGVSLRNIDSVDYRGKEYFYPDFVRLVKLVREASPGARIVIGGSGFSLFARDIMADVPEIDYGVFLEGEETFQELLSSLDDPAKVKGVFYRHDGAVAFAGRRGFVDLRGRREPAYDLFDVKRYVSRGIGIGIESKRGCGLKCSYCPYPFLNGNRLRMRPAVDVVDEIESLVGRYGIREFTFVDSVFNIPADHSSEICREMLRRGLPVRWSCWTNEKSFTEEYARLAVEAGCVAFPFSTDAFSDASLKLLGKNYTNKDILKTLDIAKRLKDVNIGYNFFLNPPGSTPASVFDTLKFLVRAKLALKGKMRKVFMIHRIRIEPDTRMHEIAVKEGIVKAGQSLLKPVYYTQRPTRHIELAYNAMLAPLNAAIKLRRLLRRGAGW